VLIVIGSTDILFSLDSIPAVFGVTDQPYIVFVANAFALLGCGRFSSWWPACLAGWCACRPGWR
jgi:predicted tellurium resistance membrane protein TerC